MSARDLLTSESKHFVKTITFTGASGLGLINTDVVAATITGRVLMRELGIFIVLGLTAVSGTLSLGTNANAVSLIAATNASVLDTNDHWNDTSNITQSGAVFRDQAISSDLLMEVLAADITAGVLEVSILWSPLSVDGQIS